MNRDTLTYWTYWSDANVELIARSSDPSYVSWLATALANSWMHWPRTFRGLANIGDPIGIAIIEAWLADNAAPDRARRRPTGASRGGRADPRGAARERRTEA
jgi:hypothetical protein